MRGLRVRVKIWRLFGKKVVLLFAGANRIDRGTTD